MYFGFKKTLDFVMVAGAAHTLRASDIGKIIVFDQAGACTLTLPQQSTTPLPRGIHVQFRNKQAGDITLTLQGADTLSGAGDVTGDATKLNAVYLETAGAPNTWVSVGDLA